MNGKDEKTREALSRVKPLAQLAAEQPAAIRARRSPKRRKILRRYLEKWEAEYNQRQAERAAALRAREKDSEAEEVRHPAEPVRNDNI